MNKATRLLPHVAASSLSTMSALGAVYPSPDEIDPADAKIQNFRSGPEISIGSLKMNLFGLFFGIVGVSLGVLWWLGLAFCQLFQFITRQKFDPQWRLPVEVSNLWGIFTLGLTNCYPVVTGKENLKAIYKAKTPVMFVANHSSWMDIYFTAMALRGRNFKMIAKKDLLKVPFLGKSLKVAKHITLDRDNRKSQFQTYKQGVKYLKNGVNLVTFAEGTRSADGRLSSFKKGAFKMASAVGASIVPVTISYAHLCHPKDYIFPMRMGRRIPASVQIGEPIETKGKEDEELMDEVWYKIAATLPESQKPLVGTPKVVS